MALMQDDVRVLPLQILYADILVKFLLNDEVIIFLARSQSSIRNRRLCNPRI